jgi:hypothetical protein
MASLESYCFNIVNTNRYTVPDPDIHYGRDNQVTWQREAQAFAGTPDEFAEATLARFLSDNPRLVGEFVFVNVWHAGRAGVFDPKHIVARATHDPKASIRRSKPVSGGALPATGGALVLRTDFSDDAAWEAVCAASAAPTPEEFTASLSFVSDPAFAGMTIDQVASLTTASFRTYFFVVDHVTITDPEMPLIALDMHDEPGRWFRVIPSRMASVENNLSLSNMSFHEFADSTDPDNVFRGFPGQPR